ncbi:recombination-associated protein RdgC, partial [Haemophilus influenzae]
MYWFRNAIIYQLTKQIDFENIEKQLKECEFTPCGSADVSHFG